MGSEGKSYTVRQVLAVPASSEDVKVPDELIPGSAKRKAQLLHLRPFSEALRTELFNRGREMSFRGVSTFLTGLDGFADTCDIYKLPKQGRVARFLRLFGFLLSGRGPGTSVQLPASSASSQPARPTGYRSDPADPARSSCQHTLNSRGLPTTRFGAGRLHELDLSFTNHQRQWESRDPEGPRSRTFG